MGWNTSTCPEYVQSNLESRRKKVVGEPDEGKPHVRFDVAGDENQDRVMVLRHSQKKWRATSYLHLRPRRHPLTLPRGPVRALPSPSLPRRRILALAWQIAGLRLKCAYPPAGQAGLVSVNLLTVTHEKLIVARLACNSQGGNRSKESPVGFHGEDESTGVMTQSIGGFFA